jgi:hypothetical protein
METRKSKVIVIRALDLEMLAQLMEQETLTQEELDFLFKAAEDIKAYAESKNTAAPAVDNTPAVDNVAPTENSADVAEAEERNRMALILELEEKE